MTELKIEKGIPIPQKGWGTLMSVLRKMDVGDSVFYPTKTSASSVMARANRDPSKKFIARKEGEGSRIWRVE